MKKIILFISAVIFAHFTVFSQGPNCNSAAAFCSGSTSYPAGVSAGTAQAGPNYGCLGSEPNPAWFFMQVSTPGNIALTITASPPRDIDFILYGPFSSPTAPCTAQLTAGNTEDCSYAGGTAPEVADITGGLAGEYYLLLLTNYSNQPTNVSFSQTSGGGSTSCAVLCSLTGLTASPSACAPASNTYSLSGQITFTTQPTTGTLTVTSSCGGSQTFSAPFTSPINYNIPGITSNGAACSVTATFSATPSCTRTTNYTSPPACTPCTATASSPAAICSGASLPLTAGTVTGATSYSWAGPGGFTAITQNPTIPAATVAASGTYTVTVTTPSAVCTATTTTVVNATPTAPTAGNSGPVCSGSTLNLTATTVAGATYTWTGPAGFSSSSQNPSIPAATNTATGTYSVTVTLNGCTGPAGTTSAIVNNTPNPPIPSINGSTTPSPVCAGATLTLTANNIAGATYAWTGPSGYTAAVRNPSPILSSTPAMSGTYSLTVTVGGCISNPATVTITVNAIPTAPTAPGAAICSGTTATLTASVSGGTYEWYDAASAGTLLFTGASFTTPALTTTTTYYVQSTNSGCIGPRTAVTVTVSPSFTVVSSADDSICSGTSATLGVISPSTGTYNYSWDAPSMPAFSTSASPSVTPATTTTYTVTLTDGIGCTGSDVVTITVGAPLTITASGVAANCYNSCNGTGNVIPSGGIAPYTYLWSTGATTPAITGLCAGTDSVTVVDVIGCSVADSIMILQPTQILLTTATLTSHCNQPDGSASLNATGGVPPYTYMWSPGGSTNDTAFNLVPTTYTAVCTDSHGCTATATAIVPNTPGVTATVASTPISCHLGCDGTATVTASAGIPPYTYMWSDGQNTATAVSLCSNTYNCLVTDSTGCTITVTVTLAQPTAVFVDALPPVPAICIGQSATLNATATGGTVGSAGYTFNWTAPAFTGNPNIVSPVTTTTYTVTATDGNGCASSNQQTITVTVHPPLSVTASNDETICEGGSALLSAIAGGGDGTYIYNWMPGAGNASTFNVSPLTTTTYTITLTDGCTSLSATDVVTITVKPLPNVNFNSDLLSGCAPLSVKFNDLTTVGSGSITGWSWLVDGNTYFGATPTVVIPTAGIYSVTLTDTSNFGCVNTHTINNMITVSAMPHAEFTYDPNPISITYPTVQFSDQSQFATAWMWNFADSVLNPLNNFSNVPSPNHTYSDVGTYCVQLIVNNTPACADTTINCLIVNPDFTFYIPNSFSPNGSGLNDEFYAKGENIAEFEMLIYDRWGNLVFRANDINQHWKGTVKSGTEIAQEDVYVYIINLKDKVGEKHQYIGHVTIVK